MTNYGYAVVTINQASQHAEEVEGVFWDEGEAEAAADVMRTYTASVGRRERYVVCTLEGVQE